VTSEPIRLRPLDDRLRPAVLTLGLGPGQEKFSGAPAQNPAAIAVYRRAGFVDTGRLYLHGTAGPQHVLVLDVA
jgi:hypothetical protein